MAGASDDAKQKKGDFLKLGYYEELPELDINDVLEDMKIYKNAVLVDVRTPEEYAEGHVPGAINLEAALCGRKNRAYVESVLPDKTAHVCMYCCSGLPQADGLRPRREHRRLRRVRRTG